MFTMEGLLHGWLFHLQKEQPTRNTIIVSWQGE